MGWLRRATHLETIPPRLTDPASRLPASGGQDHTPHPLGRDATIPYPGKVGTQARSSSEKKVKLSETSSKIVRLSSVLQCALTERLARRILPNVAKSPPPPPPPPPPPQAKPPSTSITSSDLSASSSSASCTAALAFAAASMIALAAASDAAASALAAAAAAHTPGPAASSAPGALASASPWLVSGERGEAPAQEEVPASPRAALPGGRAAPPRCCPPTLPSLSCSGTRWTPADRECRGAQERRI